MIGFPDLLGPGRVQGGGIDDKKMDGVGKGRVVKEETLRVRARCCSDAEALETEYGPEIPGWPGALSVVGNTMALQKVCVRKTCSF